jgi:hypothetical protein
MQMKTCKSTCKNAKNPKLKVQKDEQRETKLFYTKKNWFARSHWNMAPPT